MTTILIINFSFSEELNTILIYTLNIIIRLLSSR